MWDVQKFHDVVEAEPSVTTLAYAVERQLAAVTEPLHGVDVQVEHLRDFARREHRSEIADSHRRHVGVCLASARTGPVRAHLGTPGGVPAAVGRSVAVGHGVKGREIATAIGRSYPATRVLLHRGRLRLRASVELGEVA